MTIQTRHKIFWDDADKMFDKEGTKKKDFFTMLLRIMLLYIYFLVAPQISHLLNKYFTKEKYLNSYMP